MTPETFAKGLHEAVVEDNLQKYSTILETESANNVTDEYWRAVLLLYASLDIKGKAAVRAIMQQVTIDAISSVLAIIDGVTGFKEQTGRIKLVVDDEDQVCISGYLQDTFLELEE